MRGRGITRLAEVGAVTVNTTAVALLPGVTVLGVKLQEVVPEQDSVTVPAKVTPTGITVKL
jgi:hypothetical protein